MSGSNRLAMFLLGATLALGFGWSASTLSGALVRMRQENLIRVKGLAERQIASNHASWECDLWARAADLPAGYAALEASRRRVGDHLAAAGILPAELAWSPVGISAEHRKDEKGNPTNAIEFHVLSQSATVRTADVAKVDRVSKGVTDLIRGGVELRSNPPRYVYTELESVKMDLLGKATKNAHERAVTLAANSGGRVGALNAASQGIFQITPVHSTETSDGGCYDTTTIDKSVKAVVTLEFQVER
jgi:hypothetical protein